MDDHAGSDDRPIIVAAPFSPEGSGTLQHLGAANKIRAVIRILARGGRRMILLNSAHNDERLARSRTESFEVAGRVVESIIPFTLPVRPVGKLGNLLASRSYAGRLAQENPALVWVYNGYAFDSAVGLRLARAAGCPLVLELEDWPTARFRGANPKPYIDLAYFKKVLGRAALVTCVNDATQRRVAAAGARSMLLPGTLAPELMPNELAARPFTGGSFTLGYFGGLNEEKGADLLLQLLPQLPSGWNLVVCGAGELRDRFLAAGRKNRRLRFYESLSADSLYPLVRACDAIVNPHRPIKEMADGVFPFKVFEALAARKLLISTELPECGIDLAAVVLFDGSTDGLVSALRGAENAYVRRARLIDATADELWGLYSDQALYDSLLARIPALASTERQIGPYSAS
jgi:glycosyltransferase involved in cell wall biosynthesis